MGVDVALGVCEASSRDDMMSSIVLGIWLPKPVRALRCAAPPKPAVSGACLY
ncbi:hypothetical protein SSTG_01742 [Streptomyces sp. e14]|nr:hypothetical protein SSTG_01742 [Streptomyces sp. e14]